MYHFQVPPSWPLPHDFIPYEGWEPPLSFEFVSKDWEFWVLEDYDPTLPVAVNENRGEFNNHVLESAARQLEARFIQSKESLNTAISTAYADRKNRERHDKSVRYNKTNHEKYVETLIRELVHLGSAVRQARIQADEEYEKLSKKLSEANNASPYKSPSLANLTPPPVPVYQTVPKYVGKHVKPSSRNEEPVKPSRNPRTPQTSNDNSAELFWNDVIQRVNQMSVLSLGKDKQALLVTLEQAKSNTDIQANLGKENAERSHRAVNEVVEAKLRKADKEAELKLLHTEEKIATRLAEANKECKAKLLAADAEADNKLRKADSFVEAQLVAADEEIQARLLAADRQVEAKLAEADLFMEAKLVAADEEVEAKLRQADQHANRLATTVSEEIEVTRKNAEREIEARFSEVEETIKAKLLAADKEAETKLRNAAYQIAEKYEAARKTVEKPKEAATLYSSTGTLPSGNNLEPKGIDRKNVSSHERSQYVQRDVEGVKEREEKMRFRKEAKAQSEVETQQRAKMQEEHNARVKSENERIAALKYERSHILTALNKADDIRKHNDKAKADAIISDLVKQLNEINTALKNNDLTTANTRAGWIYVVSNVGSLGEGIVKIGVTRKQDPYDRIKELNSASVPFTFDVHVFHFTPDAVGLEAALHRQFALKKVNLINEKKEFFYASPEEVKDAMQKYSDGAVTHFTLEASAAEWRKSEELRKLRNNNY